MGIEFLVRSLRTTGVLLLVALLFGVYYYGTYPALAFFSGGVWGMINLIFLTGLIRSALRPEGPDARRTLLFLLVKFPLLYLAGYFLLTVDYFDPVILLFGSMAVLAVIVLKAFGRLLLGLDGKKPGDAHTQKAI